MTLEKQKAKAKFLDTRMDDKIASAVNLANLLVLGATLAHDGDHIYQACRWKYKIPLPLLVINMAVYVMPAISAFLIKNKRSAAPGLVMAEGIVTSAAFLKLHLWKPTTDVWGIWNYNYFKLNKGVMYDGKWMQGINWIDWALLFILPVASIPAFIIANQKRKELKALAENAED